MILKLLPFITFTIIFLSLANWHIFITLFTGLSKPKAPYEKIENYELTSYIQDKTGIQISNFYLINSQSVFGSMTSIPTRPIMTISTEMYNSFTQQELHYILLHETGHYSLFHSMKELLIQIGIIIIAIYIFRSVSLQFPTSIFIAFLSAMILGIAVIQITRNFEWQADEYALQHLDNPQSMINATKKLEKAWDGKSDNRIMRLLFYRGIPYSNRIQHAETYIVK